MANHYLNNLLHFAVRKLRHHGSNHYLKDDFVDIILLHLRCISAPATVLRISFPPIFYFFRCISPAAR